jgi:hypothetical protein
MQAQVLTAVAPLLYMKEAVKSMKWRLKQLPHQQQVASFQARSRTGISKWIELVNEVSKNPMAGQTRAIRKSQAAHGDKKVFDHRISPRASDA